MNRYNTCHKSIHKDEFGNYYFDIFTLPLENLKITNVPQEYILTENDIVRFDLLIYRVYGNCSYDELVLYYNKIGSIYDVTPGTKIYFPSKTDLDNFYNRNFK
jgi:hypothetical protein